MDIVLLLNMGGISSFFLETVLPVVAVAAIIGFVIWYTVFLNKKVNSDQGTINWRAREDRRIIVKHSNLIISNFLESRRIPFYEALRTALPKHYIVYPNVAIELLFDKSQRKDLHIEGEYADFVVFTINYVPALVIDLTDVALTGEKEFHIKEPMREIIRKSGIALMDYSMREVYGIDELRRAIAKAMNPLYGDPLKK